MAASSVGVWAGSPGAGNRPGFSSSHVHRAVSRLGECLGFLIRQACGPWSAEPDSAGRGAGTPAPSHRCDFQAAEHLVGQPHGAEAVLAADLRARLAPRRRDEVLELQGQRLGSLALDLVDPEHLAEDVLLDRGRLAEVQALEVEPAPAELRPDGRTSVACRAAKSSEA